MCKQVLLHIIYMYLQIIYDVIYIQYYSRMQ